jgi:hypothetical protein
MATSVANSAGQGTSHVGPVTAGELDPANILKSAAAAGAKMLADKRRSEETLGGQSVLFGNCVPTSEEGQGPAAKRVAMGIEPKPVSRKSFLHAWMLSESGKSNPTDKA